MAKAGANGSRKRASMAQTGEPSVEADGGLAEALATRLSASAPAGIQWTEPAVRAALEKTLQALPPSAEKTELEQNLDAVVDSVCTRLGSGPAPVKRAARGRPSPAAAAEPVSLATAAESASLATTVGFEHAVLAAVASPEQQRDVLELMGLCLSRRPCPPELLGALDTCPCLDSKPLLRLCCAMAGVAVGEAEVIASFLPAARRCLRLADAGLAAATLASLSAALARTRVGNSGVASAATPFMAPERRRAAPGSDDSTVGSAPLDAEAAAIEACGALVLVRNGAGGGAVQAPPLDADLRLLGGRGVLGTLRWLTGHTEASGAEMPAPTRVALVAGTVRAGHGGCIETYLLTLAAARAAQSAATLSKDAGCRGKAARVLEQVAVLAPPPTLGEWAAARPPSAVMVAIVQGMQGEPAAVSRMLLHDTPAETLQAAAAAAAAAGTDGGQAAGTATGDETGDGLTFFLSTERDATLCASESDSDDDEEDDSEGEDLRGGSDTEPVLPEDPEYAELEEA